MQIIKLLIRKGIKIKNILIGLDEFSYRIHPDTHKHHGFRRIHYLANNDDNIFFFYAFYLFARPSFYDIMYMFNHVAKDELPQRFDYDIYNTGRPITPLSIINRIEENKEEHILSDKFSKPRGSEEPTEYMECFIDKVLMDIKKIVGICRKENINCVFFINPIHKTVYLDTNFDDFITFKRGLSKETGYYDFSGINSITKNNYFYYGISHYREMVGEYIMDVIFNNGINSPADFGKYIDHANINTHVKWLSKQIKPGLNLTSK